MFLRSAFRSWFRARTLFLLMTYFAVQYLRNRICENVSAKTRLRKRIREYSAILLSSQANELFIAHSLRVEPFHIMCGSNGGTGGVSTAPEEPCRHTSGQRLLILKRVPGDEIHAHRKHGSSGDERLNCIIPESNRLDRIVVSTQDSDSCSLGSIPSPT
ncbi:hypothetical protein CC85DRAFT_285071 [Cutaneotrichosporon oleaginosum]|uniref:Uncharacterized protein n=1 Tax=Cutaneotrichosporon oleaginosum TaxID=879819 RepID=A0A0J0XP87_9TREE|nr:uncharacterized protein CC85DRAFT_285071 [Cutaneotrichosporon oleaginosum]KLT42920.1 hypothetical protein CC85DRAFT_285071 [Cutaneotrichosporon oleaginosum]TXT12623.1 hypothetical protein COLE_03033 [Cutaneotrichosporon oleaginosum]